MSLQPRSYTNKVPSTLHKLRSRNNGRNKYRKLACSIRWLQPKCSDWTRDWREIGLTGDVEAVETQDQLSGQRPNVPLEIRTSGLATRRMWASGPANPVDTHQRPHDASDAGQRHRECSVAG